MEEGIPQERVWLECQHDALAYGPHGATSGRAWCSTCNESAAVVPWPVCVDHEAPDVFVIVGRDSCYFACGAAGCRQAAESDHRMENGAGYQPTVRRWLEGAEQ